MIRPMELEDTRVTASLHASTMPEVFLTHLGPRFLRRYHEAFMHSPHALALVAVETSGSAPKAGGRASDAAGKERYGEEVRGFLLAAIDPPSHYRYMLRRHGLGLASAALLHASFHPKVALELVRTRARRYARGLLRILWQRARSLWRRSASSAVPSPVAQPVAAAHPEPPIRVSELVDVAVDPRSRGVGFGAALVASCIEAAAKAGSRYVELVTPRGEAGAGGFYESLGWSFVRYIESQSKERFALYRFDLAGNCGKE